MKKNSLNIKLFLQMLVSSLLCLTIISMTPQVILEFYYHGAFMYYRGILRLMMFIILPLLLLSYLIYSSDLKESVKKIILNIIWWYGAIFYSAILGFIFFGGARRDYDYSGLIPNYIPFSSIVRSVRVFQEWGDLKNLIGILGNSVLVAPLSFLLSFKARPTKKIYVLGSLLIVLVCVEIVQQVLHVGVFDIDDVILNLIGAGLGILAQIIITRFIVK